MTRTRMTHVQTQKPPSDRSTEFVAVEGGGETTSAEALLVAAYLVMWAILLSVLVLTWRKQSKLEKRLNDLEKSISLSEHSAEA